MIAGIVYLAMVFTICGAILICLLAALIAYWRGRGSSAAFWCVMALGLLWSLYLAPIPVPGAQAP